MSLHQLLNQILAPWIFAFVFLANNSAMAQSQIGFVMSSSVNSVEIPFEQFNNLIVIPVKINHTITLKFVLDTGAESVILTEKLFADVLKLNYVREININAPGVEDSITAFVANDVSLTLDLNLKGSNFNMLVLKEDYIELNKNLGEEVHGIIGYDIFQRYVVDIRYDENLLIIHRPETFRPRSYQTVVPIEIDFAKPHVPMIVEQNGNLDTLRFMIDTGASHAALIDVNSSGKLTYPENVLPTRLGRGLGGEIPGEIGRMDKCYLSKFTFDDVLVSIPQEGAYIKAIKRGTKHGTIGGDLLTRFNVVFDYVNEKMYLDKSHNYKKPFEYNMSGIHLIVEGDQLNILRIAYITPNSPAEFIELQRGDYIFKINGQSLKSSTFSDIQQLLRSRSGKKIRIVIYRDGKKIKKKFRLKRLI